MTDVVFVHGALVRDGQWWWRPVAERLEGGGVGSRAVLLPSCGETGAAPGSAGLVEDAVALRSVLDDVGESGGDAVVVAHSYGGTVAAEGADHPAVRHLVLISSYLPDVGSAQAEIMSDEPDPVRVAPGEDGTIGVDGYDVRSFADRFLQDVPDSAVREAAWDRVVRQSVPAFVTRTTRAAWRNVPTMSVVCADDRSTSVGLQRFHAARATSSVELGTGHHPFLSDPDAVADVVRGVMAR